MEIFLEDFIQNRPQRLCLKCGKCCEKELSLHEYKVIKELALKGDKNSQFFMESFEKISEKDSKSIYKCKHLTNENLCEIYDIRPQFCRDFPSTPFIKIPDGCGFYGWLFIEREKITKKIRHKKEILIELNAEYKFASNHDKMRIKKSIENIENQIKIYDKYGSSNW